MTKRISALLIALLLIIGSVACISAAGHPDRVCDYADLLSDSEENALRSYADDISTTHNCDVVIVTIDSIGSSTPQAAADDFYDYNSYGMGSDNSGVLLLLAMDSRDWYISTCGYGIEAFTDAGIEYIGNKIVPYLADGEYYDAFNKYIGICDDFLLRAENGNPYDVSKNEDSSNSFFSFTHLIMAIGVAVIVAFVIVSVMKGQLKSVRSQYSASDYVRPDSFKLTEKSDLFLYSHVSRSAKPKESSSSSSSSHGGSSTHVSSSGTTHGGGGGKF